MSRQPVGLIPITVPTVASDTDRDGIMTLWVEGLTTTAGPEAVKYRHAWLRLTHNQAEVLLHELAAKLGLEVTP